MPQVFKVGPFWIYFWANEGKPMEPVHVHVSEGSPTENATKIWITSTGSCLLANNNCNIYREFEQLHCMVKELCLTVKEYTCVEVEALTLENPVPILYIYTLFK